MPSVPGVCGRTLYRERSNVHALRTQLRLEVSLALAERSQLVSGLQIWVAAVKVIKFESSNLLTLNQISELFSEVIATVNFELPNCVPSWLDRCCERRVFSLIYWALTLFKLLGVWWLVYGLGLGCRNASIDESSVAERNDWLLQAI